MVESAFIAEPAITKESVVNYCSISISKKLWTPQNIIVLTCPPLPMYKSSREEPGAVDRSASRVGLHYGCSSGYPDAVAAVSTDALQTSE